MIDAVKKYRQIAMKRNFTIESFSFITLRGFFFNFKY